MSQGMGCVLGGLLGPPEGLAVDLVEREADGSYTVHVRAVAGVVAAARTAGRSRAGCGRPSGTQCVTRWCCRCG